MMEAMHEHRAKHNTYNLSIPRKFFIAVLNNPSHGAVGILQHLIDIDDDN
jgi:hypothetical protein